MMNNWNTRYANETSSHNTEHDVVNHLIGNKHDDKMPNKTFLMRLRSWGNNLTGYHNSLHRNPQNHEHPLDYDGQILNHSMKKVIDPLDLSIPDEPM